MNIGYVLENEEKKSEKASNSLNKLKKTAKDAGTEIADVFAEAIDCIETLTVAMDKLSAHAVNISESLAQVATVDFGSMLQELSAISEAVTQVTKELSSVGWEEYVALGMQAFSAGFDVFTYLNPQKKNAQPITETLTSVALGKVGFDGLGSEAEAETGILSKGFSKLREALDGVNLSQIAATASQWIQNAAMKAWEGICKVATFVTSGLGTAMSFLTSPITLVVLGIAALIAIVVLLVKNWDTVKAALIAGWEAVQQAFAVAAEWFDTNVIQPLVGFFTGLWDQICLIVTNVTTFISTKFQEFALWIQTAIANVQAVFMGIDAFLQGVFATDWTNQFGAFGEVLNAFFANVENIWNAVKTIFNGIVDFVKGVFAGDWQAAWDGIVQVFTGIWEGLQAAIKGPINGIIGMINGLVSAVVSGINSAISGLNSIQFTIPEWFPGGGGTFGFNIPLISAPHIPYLAQGAVLPANRPFLAVVGDQKSGTNVEAPLATIQEALANVLAQQGPGDIRITFTGDLAQLARVLKPAIEREDRRVGGSLARGVAV